MPNSIGADGLETATRAELVDDFTTSFQAIYGADINLASDTPDGQILGIFVQAILDLEDLLVQIYNTFDPDNAVGVILDQRVAINGIQRQAGTYTTTPITIVTSAACNLYGVDQSVQPIYTVQDNSGNKWELLATQTISGAGTTVAEFRSTVKGANLTVPNTINTPVTVVLGVTSVNNPTTYTTLGINQESDAALKVRRQKSVSLSSQGYLAGLLAALENINGVTSAFVYENTTGSTDSDGVPGHSIWVIVAGTATEADIANAIYTKRNAGCGMFGDTVYPVVQINGTTFNVKWDTVLTENLFISFTATSIDGINQPDIAGILAGLPSGFVPGVNEEVDINHLATAVQVIDPNTLVTDAGFSTGKTQELVFSGISASGGFKVNYNGNASATINWNDNAATIEGKLQAVSGLEDATVSGSIASQSVVVDLSALVSVLSILTITNNNLATSGPVAVTITTDLDPQTTLTPDSKRYQFVVAAENIVITPIIIDPSPAAVEALADQQFNASGGYGAYTWSISVNNSGGSIDASTGLYTAGSTPSTDTIKVVDELGNLKTASAVVS